MSRWDLKRIKHQKRLKAKKYKIGQDVEARLKQQSLDRFEKAKRRQESMTGWHKLIWRQMNEFTRALHSTRMDSNTLIR